MRVLIACEYSGTVRDAFIRHGFDTMSADLLDTETPGPHYKGDVRQILCEKWDMVIAHPPCTRIANSGVSWLSRRDLWDEMIDAANFFRMFLELDVQYIAVENPIPHKYAIELIGRKYDDIIQPYHFGDNERKATCLWLKNLPPLLRTRTPAHKPKNRLANLGQTKNRAKLRSKTYPGIAEAMAIQWGNFIKQNQTINEIRS